MTAPSRPQRLFSVAGNSVLWVTAVLGAISLVLGLATIAAGIQPLIFRSSSMAPAIDAGALALARTVGASEVEVGDIVTVTSADGVLVTHRVMEIESAEGDQVSLTLKGDANAGPDEAPYLVTEVDQVFLDIPYVGYLANWMASPWTMFAAGIVAALLLANLWNRRSPRSGRPTVGAARPSPTHAKPRKSGSGAASGAAVVAAAGLAAAGLAPLPLTEAYFSDPATFEAGVIQATDVTIFDLGESACVADGNNIKIRWKVPSSRFTTIWFRTAPGAAPSGTPIRELDPGGARDTPVETTFTRSELANAGTAPVLGQDYDLVGQSRLRGSATTPWVSPAVRRIGISFDATKVNCGSTNLPPVLDFSAPTDGWIGTNSQADQLTNGVCGQNSPCGTATDANGISRVEYKLQRTQILRTSCWDPGYLGLGAFTNAACSDYRTADLSVGGAPGSVVWRIPASVVGTFAFNGNYTLYIRVTDNASPTRAVTERVIRFTIT